MNWFGEKLMCRDVTRLLSQSQDARLPLVRRIRLRAHLVVCGACARFDAQLRFLRDAMQRYRC